MSKITKRARTRNDRSERKVRRDKFDRVQNDRRAAAGKPLCKVHTEWIRLRRVQAKSRRWLSRQVVTRVDVKRAHNRADELFQFIAFVVGEYIEPHLDAGLIAGSRMVDVRIQAFIRSAWHLWNQNYGVGVLMNLASAWSEQRCLVCGNHSILISCWTLSIKKFSRDVEALSELGVYLRSNGMDFWVMQELSRITNPWRLRAKKASSRLLAEVPGEVERRIDQLTLGPVSLRQARMALEFCYSAWRGRPKRLPRFSDLFRVAPLVWDEDPPEALWNMYCGVRAQYGGLWRTKFFSRVSGLEKAMSDFVHVIGELITLFDCPEPFRRFWSEHKRVLVLPDFDVATLLLGESLPSYSQLLSDLVLDEETTVQQRILKAGREVEEAEKKADTERRLTTDVIHWRFRLSRYADRMVLDDEPSKPSNDSPGARPEVELPAWFKPKVKGKQIYRDAVVRPSWGGTALVIGQTARNPGGLTLGSLVPAQDERESAQEYVRIRDLGGPRNDQVVEVTTPFREPVSIIGHHLYAAGPFDSDEYASSSAIRQRYERRSPSPDADFQQAIREKAPFWEPNVITQENEPVPTMSSSFEPIQRIGGREPGDYQETTAENLSEEQAKLAENAGCPTQ